MKVVLVRKKSNNQLYAMKIIQQETLVEEGEVDAIMSENKILQNDSPFLVHLHYSFQVNFIFYFLLNVADKHPILFGYGLYWRR